MNVKNIALLEEAVFKWWNIALGGFPDEGIDNCSLCKEYYWSTVDNCPISNDTYNNQCKTTPYDDWYDYLYEERDPDIMYLFVIDKYHRKIAIAELNYLIKLLNKQYPSIWNLITNLFRRKN